MTVIVKDKYDKEIVKILQTSEVLKPFSDGIKAVIYDLCHLVQQKTKVPFEELDLKAYVEAIAMIYDEQPNVATNKVICNCINGCFPDLRASLKGSGYEKELAMRRR